MEEVRPAGSLNKIVEQNNMNDIQDLMGNFYDSSRWYHDRDQEQRVFDQAVSAELASGNMIGTAVKNALQKIPTMKDFVAMKSMPELDECYEQVGRMDLEIAIANTMRHLVEIRKRKAQQ